MDMVTGTIIPVSNYKKGLFPVKKEIQRYSFWLKKIRKPSGAMGPQPFTVRQWTNVMTGILWEGMNRDG